MEYNCCVSFFVQYSCLCSISKSIPFQDENNNSDISTTYFTSTPHKEPADARTQETAIQNPVVTVQQVDARTQETAIQSPVVTVQQVDYKEPEDERTHETAILNLTPVVTVPHDAPVDLSLKVSRNTNKKKPKAYNCNSDVACWVKLNLKYYREHELQNFINLKCLKGIPPCCVHVHVGKRRLCPNMTELSVRVRSRYRTLPIQMLQIRSSESICRIR